MNHGNSVYGTASSSAPSHSQKQCTDTWVTAGAKKTALSDCYAATSAYSTWLAPSGTVMPSSRRPSTCKTMAPRICASTRRRSSPSRRSRADREHRPNSFVRPFKFDGVAHRTSRLQTRLLEDAVQGSGRKIIARLCRHATAESDVVGLAQRRCCLSPRVGGGKR